MSISQGYCYWMRQVLAACSAGENGTRGSRLISAQKFLPVDCKDNQKYCRKAESKLQRALLVCAGFAAP